MARLFLAFEIGDSAIPAFRIIQETLRRTIRDERVRWVTERQFHITLHIIDEVSQDLTEQFVQGLQSLRPQPVSFTTWSLEFVPHGHIPSTLILRLADLTSAAFQTHTALLSLLHDLECPTSARPWKPRVTLARMRSDTRPVDIDLKSIHCPQFTFWASSLTLFESIPGSEVRYVPLASIDLPRP